MPGIGVSTSGLKWNGLPLSENKMAGLKLKPRYRENEVTVFYEGTELPPGLPVSSEPTIQINSDEYFYFGFDLSEKEKIKQLKFHSTPAKARATGFPVLYNAAVATLGGAPAVTALEDVKVVLPVFTFLALASDTGITSRFAQLEIRDEKNVPVDLGIKPVEINDKAIEGAAAIPEFAFSIDASSLEAGIYSFKVGNVIKQFFIANGMDISNIVGLVRVLKNNFLEYKKNLADKTFAQFNLQVPAA